MKNICMKKLQVSVAVVGVAMLAFGEITTGWLEATGGTKYFNDPANWANGEVNGVFSSDLVVSTAENTISLTNGWTGTLRIFSSIGAKMNFNSAWIKNTAEGPFVLTLNDDLYLQPSTMSADVTFGNSYNAGNALNFDLGGTSRKIYMNGGSRWIFSNRMLNGDVEFVGTGTFTLRSAAGFDGDVTLPPGMTLAMGYTSSDKADISTIRAENLTLNRSQVNLSGQFVDVENGFAGTLTVQGKEFACSILYSRAQTAGKKTKSVFDGLTVECGALLLVRGSKVGKDEGADSSNIYFAEEPALIGGIIFGVIGAPTDSDTAGVNGSFDQTFVTYDDDKGLVFLDFANDYVAEIPEEGSASANLKIPHGTTITIDRDTTINSLYLTTESGTDTFATLAAENGAKIKIASGMVLIGYPTKAGNYKYPLVSAPIDFGEAPGMIIYAIGKRSQIDGSIHGMKGVTFSTPLATTALIQTSSGLVLGGDAKNSDYTGDTYVNSVLNMGTTDFLPHGLRTGNVYVNGTLSGDNFTINGLYGKGLVQRASSGGKGLTLGDNDADGDFEGDVTITDAGAVLTKIGTGTQRFAGTLELNSEIRVTAGSVVIDGTVAQGAVKVADGAVIGGKGVINTSLAFAGNATLAASKGEGKSLAPLTVNGPVTAGGTITVSAASADWKGESCVLTSTEPLTGITFAKGANVSGLELRNDGKELWARNIKGLIIMIK